MTAADAERVPTGFAILCEPEGVIASVIQPDVGLKGALEAGANLLTLIDPSSAAKASQLLLDVRLQGVSFGSELVVTTAKGPKVYSFAGFWRTDAVLVVGAPSADRLSQLCGEVEGADHTLLRQQRRRFRPLETSDTHEVFDDLTRINNELAGQIRSMQRLNRKLHQQLTNQTDQLTVLSEAVREFAVAARGVRAEPDGSPSGGEARAAFPGFLETYGLLLGDLCLFIRTDAEEGVTPLIKSRRPERLGVLAEDAVEMNRAWWSDLEIVFVVNNHDPAAMAPVNRIAVRNALAIFLAACVAAAAEPEIVIDCHSKDGAAAVQVSFVSTGKATAKFRFPQAAKRMLAENGFKVTILRGSLDRMTVILRQAATE